MESILIQFGNKGFDWQLLISAFGVIVAFFGVFGGIFAYSFQKARDYNERRLIEVYSPLYMLICKQEKIRELFFPDVNIREAPILTMVKTIKKQNYELASGKITVSEMEEVGFLDRQDFIKSLNDTNKGLASPELLRIIAEYETLVYLEEQLEKNSHKWQKATAEKVDVEYLLVKEIVYGYINTRKKLRIGNNRKINTFNL